MIPSLNISGEMVTVTSKVANMEKQTSKMRRGFKKIVRLSKIRIASKVTLKNLEDDFEREAEDERTL